MSKPVPSTHRTTDGRVRNDILRASRRLGRATWRTWSGRRRRSPVQAGMRCRKLLDERLRIRTSSRQTTEPQIRAARLDRLAQLGTREAGRVAKG